MITKKTFATTILLSSIMMVAISGTTQNVHATILGMDQFPPGTTFHLQEIVDSSGSISTVDPDGGTCDPSPGSTDLCSEWDTEKFGLALALDTAIAADLVRDGGPVLIGNLFMSVVEFGSVATLRCSGDVNSVADMTTITNCIRAMPKDDLATDIEEAFQVACADFIANPRDVHIIDLISDGEPTESSGPLSDQGDALAARDVCVTVLGGDVQRVVALGVNIDPADIGFLQDLVWPNPPGVVIGDDNPELDLIPADDGFVAFAPTFDEFLTALQNKLSVVVQQCPPEKPIGVFPDCRERDVGGEFLPIDSTPLLIAGLSANMILIAPIVLGIAGAGYYIVRTRMNKE